MLLPEVPWSLCPAEHHHSPSNIPSTVCLSSGLLGFCLDEGSSCFGARKGLCYLQHPPGWAGLELLGSEGAAGEQLLLFPLAGLVQAESVSSPIPWPLTAQPGNEGVLTLGYPALFQVRAAWGNPR